MEAINSIEVSQMIMYYIEVYMKKYPRHRFTIERESSMCVPFEIDELASFHEALSSPSANE